ncbi:MAG: ATP-binding protein [Candidatus Micrarchaeales archaeon]
MEIDEINHWWLEKKVREEFVPQTKRKLFNTIKKDFLRRQIQIVTGLRRVGKSTIFYQIIDELIKKGVNPFHILYCNFDEPELQNKRIGEILKEYSRLTNVDYKKEKIYLFLDEAQKAKDWVADVKLIYDNFYNIKILVSGSASLNIMSEAKKSLAGRTIFYELKPLNFSEFLDLKGIKIEKERSLLYKELLEKEFEKFLLRQFPELVNEEDKSFIKNYVRNSVIEPIILKDIPKEFKEVDILLLEKLVEIFLTNPGQYLQIDELAKELQRAKGTLYKAIYYLEISFLIRRVLNFRPSIRVASRKLSRVYAYHPSLLLPFNVPEEKFVENLVFFELDAKYYWREKEKEIDFLKDSIPVEVKLKSKIDKQDTRWLHFFLKKYGKKLNTKEAYIITKNIEGKIDDIYLVPLMHFCLKGLKFKV